MSGIKIERLSNDPVTPQDFSAVSELIVDMAPEVALVNVNVDDGLREVYQAMAQGLTWVARIDGKLIGAAVMIEETYWYNRSEKRWTDLCFYVIPTARGSIAAQLLWRAIRNAAIPLKIHAFITVLNADSPRGKRIIQLC